MPKIYGLIGAAYRIRQARKLKIIKYVSAYICYFIKITRRKSLLLPLDAKRGVSDQWQK